MKRRSFLTGVVAAAVAGPVAAKGVAAATSPNVLSTGRRPEIGWETMRRFHAELGGDRYVKRYVVCDRFFNQLKREWGVVDHADDFPTRLMWREAPILTAAHAKFLDVAPVSFGPGCADSLFGEIAGYAPGAPGIQGTGWVYKLLEFPRSIA